MVHVVKPQSTTALWVVSNYTACCQKLRVCDWPGVIKSW